MIKAAIKDWMALRTGLAVAWLNQVTPRPTKPYCTIQRIGLGRSIGHDYVQQQHDGGNPGILEKTYIGLRELTIQAEVYTEPADDDNDLEALDILELALMTLSAQQTTDAFRLVNLAFIDHEAPIAMDEQLGERWERRAVADIRFSYRTVLFDDGSDPPPDDGQFVDNVAAITEANSTATWNT